MDLALAGRDGPGQNIDSKGLNGKILRNKELSAV
jgi:hypothetical protein